MTLTRDYRLDHVQTPYDVVDASEGYYPIWSRPRRRRPQISSEEAYTNTSTTPENSDLSSTKVETSSSSSRDEVNRRDPEAIKDEGGRWTTKRRSDRNQRSQKYGQPSKSSSPGSESEFDTPSDRGKGEKLNKSKNKAPTSKKYPRRRHSVPGSDSATQCSEQELESRVAKTKEKRKNTEKAKGLGQMSGVADDYSGSDSTDQNRRTRQRKQGPRD